MKVWITKYALTAGISEREVTDCGDGIVKAHGRWTSYLHGEGRDWHQTREGAVARAEEMRVKKVASLKKQIAKLERLRFE